MKKLCCLIAVAVFVFTLSGGCFAVENEPQVSAKAAVVIEAGTGRVVFGKNENAKLPMASTTKIMSVLLTLESGDLDSEFVVDSEAVKTEGSSMGLMEGDIVSKRDLCIGMLLPSGNDAANCAAVKVGGSMAGFADMMNAKASRLGLKNTHFVTPSGLHDDEHYSTAYDMAQLTSFALKNEDFRAICSQKSIKLAFGDPPYDRWLANTNKLLTRYEGCIGVKTGFTDEAGRCLVSAARRDGKLAVAVTLCDPDDWRDHISLLDYGIDSIGQTSYTPQISHFSLPVIGSDNEDLDVLIEPYIINTLETEKISCKIDLPRFLYAPVSRGETVGYAEYSFNGSVIETVEIKAPRGIAATKPQQSVCSKLLANIKYILLSI